MFPVVDQNRQDAHPQTVHVHMHQVCACMHQYFPNYRPHILAPYHIQPVPRPFNMQHYQYTQFNLSPFNMPLMHPGTSTNQAASLTSTTQQTATTTLDFGPPPRDRRHFETIEAPTQDTSSADISKDNFFDDYNLTMSNLNDTLQEVHGASSTTENFTKFLEQGCIIAEKIAIRNQHRPCFKNIQNVCNRARSEILKPSNTVSNIHSQGIPWATKDFIYAFVRLINCWHMLKGYLDSKDGTLGNIDRELTPEFKSCYLAWEKNTKELAAHMIRIFTNLDNNVSNPNASTHNKIKQTLTQETSSPKLESTKIKEVVKLNRNASNAVNTELNENLLLSESPTSPRDEDSDNEGRVYMKPGSYSVPKKNNDSSNSSPSIEFFETAKNVSAHYKNIAKKKGDNGLTSSNDKMWQDAQSAVPYLMNKINTPQQPELNDRNIEDVDALKYFVDLNTLDHQTSNIQEWLNNNNFFEQQNCSDNLPETSGATSGLSMTMGSAEKPVTVLQRSQLIKMGSLVDQDLNFYGQGKGFCKNNGSRVEVQTRTYRKKGDCAEKGYGKSIVSKKSNAATWEYEKGGLTPAAWLVMEDIVKILEQEEFAKRVDCNDFALSEKTFAEEYSQVTSLATVKRKVANRKYDYVNEFVADLKSIISCAEIFYEAHHEIIHYITLFDRKLDLLLNRDFFAFDFAFLSNKTDELGPLVLKSNRKSDGDGDR